MLAHFHALGGSAKEQLGARLLVVDIEVELCPARFLLDQREQVADRCLVECLALDRDRQPVDTRVLDFGEELHADHVETVVLACRETLEALGNDIHRRALLEPSLPARPIVAEESKLARPLEIFYSYYAERLATLVVARVDFSDHSTESQFTSL